ASATRERSARARFTGAARAPGCRRGSLAFASAHAAVAPAPAGRPLASLAHGERPAPELLAVEGADRGLGLGIGGELDEGEAARPPGLPVGDDLHLFDLAPLLLEQGAQLRLVALVGQVAYVQSLSHSSSRTNEDAEDDPRRSRVFGGLVARARRHRPGWGGRPAAARRRRAAAGGGPGGSAPGRPPSPPPRDAPRRRGRPARESAAAPRSECDT